MFIIFLEEILVWERTVVLDKMEAEKLCKLLDALSKETANASTASFSDGGSPGGPHSKRTSFIR